MLRKRLTVSTGQNDSYDIVIEDSFSGLTGELTRLSAADRKICIVTETGVAPFHLETVKNLLTDLCREVWVFIFPEGESEKNLATVSRLYEFLIEKRFDRKDMLLALGGGVTGDLTGFAAATYLRGIDFVQVPTSLLAQVDSSIGGKTGVDLHNYKNMVGAFYMPRLVYINISTLHTLPWRQFVSGMGEIIKHGLIADADYYAWIREHREVIAGRDIEALAYLVEGSCRIKRKVVEEDPKEEGIRAQLNFGHTLGHAIEKLMDFTLTHGECVGIGSLLAARLSADRGFISDKEMEEIGSIYSFFGFPKLPGNLQARDIIEAAKHDKKMEKGKLKFILLKAVGEAFISSDVTDDELYGLFDQKGEAAE